MVCEFGDLLSRSSPLAAWLSIRSPSTASPGRTKRTPQNQVQCMRARAATHPAATVSAALAAAVLAAAALALILLLPTPPLGEMGEGAAARCAVPVLLASRETITLRQKKSRAPPLPPAKPSSDRRRRQPRAARGCHALAPPAVDVGRRDLRARRASGPRQIRGARARVGRARTEKSARAARARTRAGIRAPPALSCRICEARSTCCCPPRPPLLRSRRAESNPATKFARRAVRVSWQRERSTNERYGAPLPPPHHHRELSTPRCLSSAAAIWRLAQPDESAHSERREHA